MQAHDRSTCQRLREGVVWSTCFESLKYVYQSNGLKLDFPLDSNRVTSIDISGEYKQEMSQVFDLTRLTEHQCSNDLDVSMWFVYIACLVKYLGVCSSQCQFCVFRTVVVECFARFKFWFLFFCDSNEKIRIYWSQFRFHFLYIYFRQLIAHLLVST